MDTFVESMNFEGKNIILFCTSGSSGIEESVTRLKERANGGNWKKGKRFGSGSSKEEIENWIDSLNK